VSAPSCPRTSTFVTERQSREGGRWEWRRPVWSCLIRVLIRPRLSKMTDMCVRGSLVSSTGT
jgi:hypothetical protein